MIREESLREESTAGVRPDSPERGAWSGPGVSGAAVAENQPGGPALPPAGTPQGPGKGPPRATFVVVGWLCVCDTGPNREVLMSRPFCALAWLPVVCAA